MPHADRWRHRHIQVETVLISLVDALLGESAGMSVAALIHFVVPVFGILQGGDSGGGARVWNG